MIPSEPAPQPKSRRVGKFAVAAAAVVTAVMIGGVALAALGGSDDKGNYAGACPSGPGAAVAGSGEVSSTTVACDGLTQTDDEKVVRIIELVSPKNVPLNWGYCNGLTCGTPENAECVSNLWMPQFGSQLPATVTVQGLGPSAKVTGVRVGVGPSPGNVKEAKGVTTKVGADGTVKVDLSALNAVAARLARAINPNFKQVCGVPETDKNAITDKYGKTYDNTQQAYIRIQIEMQASQQKYETLSRILDQQNQTSKGIITNIGR